MQGIERGEAVLLLKMLDLKYGTLPDWASEKVVVANEKQVEDWAAKMLSAKTLEAVFEQ